MTVKRILMIGTGGTIASEMSPSGLTPELNSDQLLSFVPRIGELCHVDCIQLYSLDSTNIRPAHWLGAARTIRERYDDYDGFVISHGTDTMAYTAAALSYLIQGSPKPIILTGAQKPIWFDGTDSKRNLTDAFLYACRGCGGVQIVLGFMLERYDGLVIESFGVGGLPEYEGDDSYYDIIRRGVERGKIVVMTTQVPNEGSDLTVYHVGGRLKSTLRLLEAYDMTTEAAVAKLMWILGRTREFDEAEKLFYQPVARDILYEN